MSEVKTPWKDYMGDVPMHLDYFQGSMFEAVEREGAQAIFEGFDPDGAERKSERKEDTP